MAKKKKRKRGRPKGSGAGTSRKKIEEMVPDNLEEMHDIAKSVADAARFVVSTISRVGKTQEKLSTADQLKKLNVANQAIGEVQKDLRLGRYFFRDYLKKLREKKKSEVKRKVKKGKGKKKKKRSSDDDE